MTNLEGILTFQKNVTTSGTPVQLTSAVLPDGVSIIIKAKDGNTGSIRIGGSSAQAINSGSSYLTLGAGKAITVQVINASSIWIDASVSGEGVECLVEQIGLT